MNFERKGSLKKFKNSLCHQCLHDFAQNEIRMNHKYLNKQKAINLLLALSRFHSFHKHFQFKFSQRKIKIDKQKVRFTQESQVVFIKKFCKHTL